jgi:hypothetical protein
LALVEIDKQLERVGRPDGKSDVYNSVEGIEKRIWEILGRGSQEEEVGI